MGDVGAVDGDAVVVEFAHAGEKVWREFEAFDLVTAGGEEEGVAAHAAADIEDAGTGADAGDADDFIDVAADVGGFGGGDGGTLGVRIVVALGLIVAFG